MACVAQCLILLAGAVSLSHSAGPLVTGGEKILFIGNSLTAWGELPNRVQEACAAGGVPVTTSAYIEGATELIDIYNHGAANVEIRKGWNIVVLQGWTHAQNAQPGDREKLIKAVVWFNAVIESAGAKTVLYQTFPGQNQGDLYGVIATIIAGSFDSAAAHSGNAPVAPFVTDSGRNASGRRAGPACLPCQRQGRHAGAWSGAGRTRSLQLPCHAAQRRRGGCGMVAAASDRRGRDPAAADASRLFWGFQTIRKARCRAGNG